MISLSSTPPNISCPHRSCHSLLAFRVQPICWAYYPHKHIFSANSLFTWSSNLKLLDLPGNYLQLWARCRAILRHIDEECIIKLVYRCSDTGCDWILSELGWEVWLGWSLRQLSLGSPTACTPLQKLSSLRAPNTPCPHTHAWNCFQTGLTACNYGVFTHPKADSSN